MTEITRHEPTTVYIKPSKGLAALNLRDLWIYRELVFFMVWRDVKVKYKQTLLGMAWAVVQPVMTMLVFTFVFDRVANLPTDGIPYEVFSFTALLPWGLFVTALNQGSRSLVAHNNMVTKIYFPRLILPMSSVFAGLVDFAIAFVILVGLMFYYRVMPAWQVLWTLPLFLLLAVVTALAGTHEPVAAAGLHVCKGWSGRRRPLQHERHAGSQRVRWRGRLVLDL